MERKNRLPPVHPGEIYQGRYPALGRPVGDGRGESLGHVPPDASRHSGGRKPLSAVMCLEVARLFGSTPELGMRLQAAYDLKKAGQDKKATARVARIVSVKPVEEVRA